jgi:membrane protein YqaA with SNARE-associated domain
MLRRLYNWTMSLSAKPEAPWALAAGAFAESSFFPFPPDVLLVPMVLAQPQKAWRYAAVCTAASVVGGMLGYLIGSWLYDSLGQWLIALYGYGQALDGFRAAYAQWGAWIILIKGLTPIPYKIVTIASGFAGYSFGLFVLLSIITRGIRFFVLAGLLRRFGEPIRPFIETRLELVATAFAVVVVGGFVVVRYVI